MIQLALLAPEIQVAILAGRQPRGTTIERLMTLSSIPTWSDQIRQF